MPEATQTFQTTMLIVGATPHEFALDYAPDFGATYYSRLDAAAPRLWNAAMAKLSLDRDELWSPVRDVSDDVVQRVFATQIRFHYLHLLEVFWAHTFANLQAPQAPEAWLALYRPSALRRLAQACAHPSWQVPEFCPALRHPRAAVSRLLGFMHLIPTDRAAMDDEIRVVLRLFRLFAAEFQAPQHGFEYNAIKHGFRDHGPLGKWSITLKRKGQPDKAAQLASEWGSHFWHPTRVGPGRRRHAQVWAFVRHSVGWDPSRDLRLARVLSMLLYNLVRARQDTESLSLYSFRNLDLDKLLETSSPLTHFSVNPGLRGIEGGSAPEVQRTVREFLDRDATLLASEFTRWTQMSPPAARASTSAQTEE